MCPRPTTLLGLVLCLGQTIHMQDGVLPKPSIWAEPGTVIPRGRPVTIVCQGPAWAESYRLEKKDEIYEHRDQKNVSQHGSQGTEARFIFSAMSDQTAGCYSCLYLKRPNWSERSESLELKVTDEDVSTPPSGAPGVVSSTPLTHTKPFSSAESSTGRALLIGAGRVPGSRDTPVGGPGDSEPPLCSSDLGACPPDSSLPGDTQTNSQDINNRGLSTEHVYILVGISVAFLFCLLLLVLFLVHRQHQKKDGHPHSKDEEQRPQERLSPAVDIIESTADVATIYTSLEKNREMRSPSPAAGDPQEVTYAQLDQRALTLRAAQAVSPQSTEPTAESSMYAALTGR